MSVRAERIARIEAQLEAREEVRLIVVDGYRHGLILAGAIGGTPKTQAQAMARWYREHDTIAVKAEHAALLRAQGLRAPRRRTRGPSQD